MEDDFELDEDSVSSWPEADEIAEAIAHDDLSWQPGQFLELGDLGWQPHLVRAGKRPAVLHVHVAETLRPYAIERMIVAFNEGMDVHLAMPLERLYDEELLEM